ncbi:hypothetical protein EVAR_62091_1 [Eumeta japonica]|uniref:Uncharacterized protein n=1 Tax=Eumeta variegata TaxID=151549 RepID=A0A4C1YX55_EUMVA|nr:hypothetical protein EVAR_62091_1 [Eumeta japonica]
MSTAMEWPLPVRVNRGALYNLDYPLYGAHCDTFPYLPPRAAPFACRARNSVERTGDGRYGSSGATLRLAVKGLIRNTFDQEITARRKGDMRSDSPSAAARGGRPRRRALLLAVLESLSDVPQRSPEASKFKYDSVLPPHHLYEHVRDPHVLSLRALSQG